MTHTPHADTIRGCVYAAMVQLCSERHEPVPEPGTPDYARLRDDLEAAYQRVRKLGRRREGDDPDGILREHEEPSGPLTEGDRRWAIECALSHFADRYVERCIRAAWEHEGRPRAIEEARRLCTEWDQGGSDGWVNGMTNTSKGLFVERHDEHGDRAGFVRWSEIADTCAPVRQEQLL